MHQPVDGGHRHGRVGEHLVPAENGGLAVMAMLLRS